MAGHVGIFISNRGYRIYSDNDYRGDGTMRKKTLQFASLSLSSLLLLYLLFINVWRGSFIMSDWVVVAVDLTVKVIVELYTLTREE